MPLRTRWTLALAALLAAAVPRGAPALTLADLAGGASFLAGVITFSDFEVTIAGDLSLDLSDYPVQILSDGFRVAGPIATLFGDAGSILISYEVSTPEPLLVGASLLAPAIAIGGGAQAWVAESLLGEEGDPIASLFVFSLAGLGTDWIDSVSFAAVGHLDVVKSVEVANGLFAAVPFVDQRFFAIPEPLTLLLLGGGLVGLVFSGRRRALVA